MCDSDSDREAANAARASNLRKSSSSSGSSSGFCSTSHGKRSRRHYDSSKRVGSIRGQYTKRAKSDVVESSQKDATSRFESHEDEEYISLSLPQTPRDRAATLFQITLLPRIYDSELSRDALFNALKGITKYTVIVGLQRDQFESKFRSEQMFKIFIDLAGANTDPALKKNSLQMYRIINDLLRSILGPEKKPTKRDVDMGLCTDSDCLPEIRIEKVKSQKGAILWATSFDYDCRYTAHCNREMFAETWKREQWARNNVNKKFSLKMPFVGTKNSTSLHAYLTKHQDEHHKLHENQPVHHPNFVDWRDQCRDWWNDWCHRLKSVKTDDVSSFFKMKQLLVIGEPSCGKSLYVMLMLLRGIPSEAILRPEASAGRNNTHFAFSRARPAYHSVLFCDEFRAEQFDTEKLKVNISLNLKKKC